jgi:hypothetical protein
MTYPTSAFELDIPLAYIETSIPEGITIPDYRRSRPRRPSLRRRLTARLMARGT